MAGRKQFDMHPAGSRIKVTHTPLEYIRTPKESPAMGDFVFQLG
jgi:hypothetical protein